MNNADDGLLDFLTDGLIGRERDAVTRAFYGYASGDPNSEPVGISVLLTACMRQLARVPEKLQNGTASFQKVVAEARALEKGIIERVGRENATVLVEFKDETRRAITAWNETITRALRMEENAREMANDMKPVVASAKQIAQDVQTLKGDLKLHEESTGKIADGVEAIKIIHQESQALIKRVSKEARANWITVGLASGMALAYALDQSQAPSWAQFIFFVVIAGTIQGFSRFSWNFVRRWTGKRKTPAAKAGGEPPEQVQTTAKEDGLLNPPR
jgi:uncharacterized protein (UPF0335 family)